EDDLVVQPSAHEAEPALPLPQLAEARAEVALDALVVDRVPVLGGDDACVPEDLGIHSYIAFRTEGSPPRPLLGANKRGRGGIPRASISRPGSLAWSPGSGAPQSNAGRHP